MTPEPSGRAWLAATVAAAPLVLAVLVVLGAAVVPVKAWGGKPTTLALLMGLLSHHAVWLLAAPLLYQLGLALLHAARLHGTGLSRRMLVATASVLAAAATSHSYLSLIRHEPMLQYPVFVVAHVLLFLVLAWAAAVALHPGRVGRIARWAPAVVGCAGFVVAHAANELLFNDTYASLHLCALEITLLLGMTGASHALARLPPRAARVGLVAAAVVAVPLIAGALLGSREATRPARPALVTHTLLGQVEVLFHPPGEWLPAWLEGAERAVARGSVARFQDACGLPKLPPDFALRDHDVLFVLSEATRFDQTSLANPLLGTTPELERLASRGAWTFRRAHAPSSRTFESVGSVMAMVPPFAVPIDPGEGWFGEVLPQTETVAEILAAEGRTTFWVGHDISRSMTTKMIGLGQGFSRQSLRAVTKPGQIAEIDANLADVALAELRRCWSRGESYFGWVFFTGGHADAFSNDYPPRLPGWPSTTKLERYRQALRATDDQLARLLAGIELAGRLEHTIIIVTADHGEAFGAHGYRLHGTHLHEEVTHVPLVLWLPGVPGHEVGRPVSLTHVFPWLLSSGDELARGKARERIENVLDPLLRDTDGSVLTELFSPDRMLSALLHDEEKLIVDFRSDVPLLFDLASDPGEQRPAFGEDPERDRASLDRFRAYWRIRQRTEWAGDADATRAPATGAEAAPVGR